MFSKIIVSTIIILNIIFTASVLYIFLKTGAEPAVLIGTWFTFTTGELWALSKIKRVKLNERREGYENKLENKINKS